LLVGSCFEPPEFSIFPEIEVENVRVKNIADPTQPDSLIISINFKDGDGNIGIDGSENGPPFHERWFFLKNPSPTCEPGVAAPCTKISFIDQTNLANYITYKLRRAGTPYDTLPALSQPSDCLKYVVLRNSNNAAIDTLYSQLNSRYFNLFISVYVKNGATFQKYEFNNAAYPNCDIYGLNSRLPILAKDGDVNSKLPLEGIITYKLTSASFTPLIGKTLMLRIQIMDRDGNLSNIDDSNEFNFN
jgi:hypothetical protein